MYSLQLNICLNDYSFNAMVWSYPISQYICMNVCVCMFNWFEYIQRIVTFFHVRTSKKSTIFQIKLEFKKNTLMNVCVQMCRSLAAYVSVVYIYICSWYADMRMSTKIKKNQQIHVSLEVANLADFLHIMYTCITNWMWNGVALPSMHNQIAHTYPPYRIVHCYMKHNYFIITTIVVIIARLKRTLDISINQMNEQKDGL